MKSVYQATEAELIRQTKEMVDAGHDLRSGIPSVVSEYTQILRHAVASRRSFLGAGAAVGAVALLAACGSGDSTTTPSPDGGIAAPDIAMAQISAGLEMLAINTYNSVISAETEGTLGSIPPAIVTFINTATEQHQDHLGQWNSLLTGAGLAAVSAPDPSLQPGVQHSLAQARTIAQVARLALTIETVATETYTTNVGILASLDYRKVALSIAPVEAQHVAILNFILGSYPVPASYIPSDQARIVPNAGGTPAAPTQAWSG